MKLIRVWKKGLYILFIFFTLHFLKDITQDIIHIHTPLDMLGNINEDLSVLSVQMRRVFEILAYLSYIIELGLLFTIVRALKKKEFSRYDQMTIIGVITMIILFSLFALTDPQFIRYKELLY